MKKFMVLSIMLCALVFAGGVSSAQELYYNGEKIIDSASYGNMHVMLVERFPTEKITLVGPGMEKNAYIVGAMGVSFDGEHIAVTGISGTYVMDMDMDIVTGIQEGGSVVSIGDFVCIGKGNSLKVFSKEDASIVCQHEFEKKFRITGLNVSGQTIDVELEKAGPETAERFTENARLLVTEEKLVEL